MWRSRQLFFACVLTFANIWHTCLGEGQVESEFVFVRSAGVTSITPTLGDTNGGVFGCAVGICFCVVQFSVRTFYSLRFFVYFVVVVLPIRKVTILCIRGRPSRYHFWIWFLSGFHERVCYRYLCTVPAPTTPSHMSQEHSDFKSVCIAIFFSFFDSHNSVFMGGDATDTLSSPIARPVNFFGLF